MNNVDEPSACVIGAPSRSPDDQSLCVARTSRQVRKIRIVHLPRLRAVAAFTLVLSAVAPDPHVKGAFLE